MESLSRPFHRNKASSATFSKKLSTAHSLSAKNAYDDVFNGAPKFGGAPTQTHSSRIEDYNEIFGGSQASRASSIPILDLSPLDEPKLSDFRSSKLDYSKIFGGFRDEDIAVVSYDQIFIKPKGPKNFSDQARTSSKTSHSDGSDRLDHYKQEVFQHEAPNQSFEGMQQFNTSYHKTSQRRNDGTNGTTHIAQLRAVPGFTCFVDVNHHLRKSEEDKSVPQPKVDVKPPPKVDAHLTRKQNSDGTGKFKSQSSWDQFYSIDNPVNANENSLKAHPSKISSPSCLAANFVSNESEPKTSMDPNFKVPESDAFKAGPGDCSPSISDEEVDVNSAAAASAAALRKALEKAQASIRMAKEIMERKKDGPKTFLKPSSKNGLDIKKRREDKVTVEASRIRENNAKEICESASVVLQAFTKSEREKAQRSGKVAPHFKESEKIFTAKEVVGETDGNKLETDKDCEALRQFSELLRTGERRTATVAGEHTDDRNNIMLSVDTHKCGRKEMETTEKILEQLDGNGKEVDEKVQEPEDMERKLNAVEEVQDWEHHAYRLDNAQEVNGKEENEKAGVGQKDEETEEKQKASSGQEKFEKKLEESLEMETSKKILEQLDGNGKEVDEETQELEDLERKLNAVKAVRDWEQHVYSLDTAQDVHGQEENEKAGVGQEDEEIMEKQKASTGQENFEKKLEESLEPNENKDEFESQEGKVNNNEGLDEAQQCMENEKKQEEGFEEEQNKLLKDVHEKESVLKKICEQDVIEKRLQAALEWEDCEEACEVESNENRQNDVHEGEDNEKSLDKIHDLDINSNRLNGTPDGEESEERQEGDSDWEGNEKLLAEACEYEETESTQRETAATEMTEVNLEAVRKTMNLAATSDACKRDVGESLSESQEDHRLKENDNLNFEENERISDVTQSSCEFKEDEIGLEAVELAQVMGEKEKTGVLVGGAAKHVEIDNKMKGATEALLFDDNQAKIRLTDMNSGPKQTDQNEKECELASNLGSGIKISVGESEEDEKKVEEDKIAFYLEEGKSNFYTAHEERQWIDEMGKKMEASEPPSVFAGEEKMIGIDEGIKASQITEKNKENLNKTFAVEENETKETAQKEMMVEIEPRKNDEASKRESEREKVRMVVERAIREARERAFAEARERAERAAVERATAEARQRVMAEAREKFEKAFSATKSSAEKASIEDKLRAERAAVERATAEARERALEKALSQKATSGARELAERFVAETFSGVSRDNAMRQSFPSSDSQKLDGTSGESAQRHKARLERHQRTMERAAKALAEKNTRDLLAQKEQAERNRFAETLDAEVKRWSSGKEWNLRALLSTLQYILGPDSGWQPISLMEIITTNAVKKAYRKATLHVHPDKLQQRGASIQQKYICEKVFDLLKAAWSRFNSEER